MHLQRIVDVLGAMFAGTTPAGVGQTVRSRGSLRRPRDESGAADVRVVAFEAVSSDGRLRIDASEWELDPSTVVHVPIAADVPVRVTIGRRRPKPGSWHRSTVAVETPYGQLRFSDGATVHAAILTRAPRSRLQIYIDHPQGATQVRVVLEA